MRAVHATWTARCLAIAACVASCKPDLRFDGSVAAHCESIRDPEPGRDAHDDTFIVRRGNRLFLADAPFRFAGANIYWLGMDENVFGSAPPSAYRVDDAFDTVSLMNGTVVRSISLGVSVGCPRCIEPTRGEFNDAAFASIDHAIARARAHHLRLIIPLLDNYRYFSGGRFTFTDWRGLTDPSCGLHCANGNAFFTDAGVRDDVHVYVDHVLTHVNGESGVAYRDDPTIMAWEVGNELNRDPRGYHSDIAAFTRDLAQFIRERAPRQLIVDPYVYADRSDDDVHDPNVDLYAGHYYPLDVGAMNAAADRITQAGKVFFVGEFDWPNLNGGERLDHFLDALVANDDVSGSLYWSLFGHRDDFGFAQHLDGYTLHFPGDTDDMRYRVALITDAARRLTDRAASPWTPPPPTITTIVAASGRYSLAWRGSAGAAQYSVDVCHRGECTTVCDRCTDDNHAPWTDPVTPIGTDVQYRVAAWSACGLRSALSELVLAPAE